MITARDLEIDQVMCLEKERTTTSPNPSPLAVLKARITALLRRSSRERETEMTLSSGAFLLDLKKMKAYRGKAELDLSPTELKLLRYFLENKNQVLLKEQILTRIWDESGSFVKKTPCLSHPPPPQETWRSSRQPLSDQDHPRDGVPVGGALRKAENF